MANSIAYVLSKNAYPDAYQAELIGVYQGTQIVYATTSTLSSSNVLYADSRLTQPIYGSPSDWYGVQLLTDDAVGYAVVISTTGSITPITNPTTTTTTSTSTTTAAPATTTTTAVPGSTEYLILSQVPPIVSAFPSTGQACAGWTNPAYSFFSVYAAESTIGSITFLYTDSGLTTPLVNTSPSVAYNSIAVPSGLSYTTPYTLQIINGTGEVSSLVAC
jgi:hypothetical protein